MNINKLVKLVKTPCFIIDEDELNRSLDGFAFALVNHFSNYIPSISVKTNSLPFLLKKAKEHGYYAEVVSADEYELALKCGYAKNHIIYNGPLKSRDTFIDAIMNDSLVNIETFRELRWLEELDKGDKEISVGFRMNVNISQISPADQNHENDNSRFGFSVESSEFDKALSMIENLPNVTFNRLHIHRTSKTRSLNFYTNLIEYALGQIQSRGIKLDFLDIGGGYFGIMPGRPSYEEYAQVFEEAISKYQNTNDLTIIIEPGNAVVASAFSFVTSVIDVKHHDDANYVTIDGSRLDVDPLFHKTDYFKQVIYSNPNNTVVEKQIIGGCTCLENDILMEIDKRPALCEGDIIHIDRVGAYTLCFTPLFIRYWPIVYTLRNNTIDIVRKKWSIKEYTQKSNNYNE